MVEKISSLDVGYSAGDLSVYPEAIDDYTTLYEAKNNAESTLKQSLTYTGKHIVVEDATGFPAKGLIRIGPPAGEAGPYELVYYDSKTSTTFKDLIRGFAGSRQSPWTLGDWVTSAVMAEHHNAVKDAVLNIEEFIGTSVSPDPASLNGIMTSLERKFLAPKPLFRAFPKRGVTGTQVRFQNFSHGDTIRHLWDFGDGSTSIERSPTHTYNSEGVFTVKLNIITSLGAQGSVIKEDYIIISEEEALPFFYVQTEDSPAYSVETATELSETPATFEFVDQTDGDIAQRYWIFDDGNSSAELDPDIHSVTHTYQEPGSYNPSLIIVFNNQQLKRVFLSNELTVL